MSKLRVSLIVCACLGMSSSAWASWNTDCEDIESKGPAQGACSAIQKQINQLNAYAPVKPFEDLTATPGTLNSQFHWGSPTWASGSGSGDTNVIDTTGGTGGASNDSSDSSSSSTF
jgi:hypothetical protein